MHDVLGMRTEVEMTPTSLTITLLPSAPKLDLKKTPPMLIVPESFLEKIKKYTLVPGYEDIGH